MSSDLGVSSVTPEKEADFQTDKCSLVSEESGTQNHQPLLEDLSLSLYPSSPGENGYDHVPFPPTLS